MTLRLYLRFAVVEMLLILCAVALGWILILDAPHNWKTLLITVTGTWLAMSALNVAELVKGIRFENSERDAEIAWGRSLGPNGGGR